MLPLSRTNYASHLSSLVELEADHQERELHRQNMASAWVNLQVDDGEYFNTLPENSIFLFLRSGEVWHPAGTDAVRAGSGIL